MSQNSQNDKPDDDKPAPPFAQIKDENDVYKRLNAYRPPENLLKKHPCHDCFNCLWCGDARCEVCLRSKGCGQCHKSEQKNEPVTPERPEKK